MADMSEQPISELPKRISSQARATFTIVAVLSSFLLCVTPIVVAITAWNTHLEWMEFGDYERNSFPMDKFARDMAWVAVASNCGVAIAWLVAWLRHRANG
jgi:hypothetical protein